MADKATEDRLKALEEQNAKLMAALEAKWETQNQSNAVTPEMFLAGIKEAMKGATQATEVLASKMKPEGDHQQKSPFDHPEGGIKFPKEAIAPKREIVWGKPLTLGELTYAEVLALQKLDASLARSQRRLARDGKWKAWVSDDDQRLTISVPVKTIDDRQDLPPFIQIVTELTGGDRELNQADILAELTMLKAKLEALEATA